MAACLLPASGAHSLLTGLLLGLNLGILDTNGCFAFSSVLGSALSTETDAAVPFAADKDIVLLLAWFLEAARSTEAD